MRTIVLTGGGTAGHVTPHVALLPHLRQSFSKIHYIGGKSPTERAIIEREGVPFSQLECVKYHRGCSMRDILHNILIPWGYLRSVKRAKAILCDLRPDVVFSKGGFVALPVVRAARGLGIPVVAHESDASMGLANKLSVGACKKICTTFAGACGGKKAVHTGSPIRPQIYRGKAEVVARRHGVKNPPARCATPFEKGGRIGNEEREDAGVARRNLLVTGGSLGAGRINAAVRENLAELTRNWNIIHICGRGKTADMGKVGGAGGAMREAGAQILGRYVQVEFVDDIENYYAWADVVVARAGSNMLCELLAIGKPTLFVPLATGRGDQIQNVRYVREANAGGVLFEKEFAGGKKGAGRGDTGVFVNAVEEVWNMRGVYAKNAPKVVKDGTKEIYNTIYGVVCEAYNTNLLRQSTFCPQGVR